MGRRVGRDPMTYVLLLGGVVLWAPLRKMPAVAMVAVLAYVLAGVFVIAVLSA